MPYHLQALAWIMMYFMKPYWSKENAASLKMSPVLVWHADILRSHHQLLTAKRQQFLEMFSNHDHMTNYRFDSVPWIDMNRWFTAPKSMRRAFNTKQPLLFCLYSTRSSAPRLVCLRVSSVPHILCSSVCCPRHLTSDTIWNEGLCPLPTMWIFHLC